VSAEPSAGPEFAHLLADFSGASASQLQDRALLSGLLIAAASAAGIAALGPPVVRQLPSGELGGMILLERCHIAAHTVPARGILLVDVLTPNQPEARKAIDVFVRRFAKATVRLEQAWRG
jgi:S-adenosylmethionine/arginine decarboxylase-like enzyme